MRRTNHQTQAYVKRDSEATKRASEAGERPLLIGLTASSASRIGTSERCVRASNQRAFKLAQDRRRGPCRVTTLLAVRSR
jgi:hypothetical protein